MINSVLDDVHKGSESSEGAHGVHPTLLPLTGMIICQWYTKTTILPNREWGEDNMNKLMNEIIK